MLRELTSVITLATIHDIGEKETAKGAKITLNSLRNVIEAKADIEATDKAFLFCHRHLLGAPKSYQWYPYAMADMLGISSDMA